MSIQEIEKAIQDTEIALSANPQGRTKELLLIGLQAFNDMLLAEQQKKSKSQLTGKTGQLEQSKKEFDLEAGLKEIANREWPKIKEKLEAKEGGKKLVEELEQFKESNIPPLPSDMQTGQQLLDKWTKEGYEMRVIGTVTAAPVITIPVVDIALSSGTKRMNRTEIMTMLKTWFKRVATSRAMEEGRYTDAYGGAMGKDTYKLFEGWNMIYNETKEGSAWPPMLDCFPGYKNASAVQKVNAELLWRWASNDK